MAGSTNKRKSLTAPSDFKRIKAKVGKRAPKQANVTDTSFRSASVSVRSQAVDYKKEGAQVVLSARGRSIEELTTQLHHPASAVRTSAIRGLSNIVSSQSDFVPTHLSILLPAIAKCCVDEDDTVRLLGLAVLRDLLRGVANEHVLRPYLALLTAYASSSLNSLDRSTRLDGARAVNVLSTALPSLMASQAEGILPAFVALLSDHSNHRSQTETSKKAKKTGASSVCENWDILRALVAILKTSPEGNTELWHGVCQDPKCARPDLTVVPGGKTVNAIVVAGRARQSARLIHKRHDLVNFSTGLTPIQNEQGQETGLNISIRTELISKLCNIVVEISQRGTHEGIKGGIALQAVDVEELTLVVAAIRSFWNAFCREMIQMQPAPKELRTVSKTLLSLLLELFPVGYQNLSSELATKYDLLNADLCTTLMDVGGGLEATSGCLNWTARVLDYALPRLDTTSMSKASNGASSAVMDVIGRLLLLRHPNQLDFALKKKARSILLERVCQAFFADEFDCDMARSPIGRKAALLVVAMLQNEDLVLAQENSILMKSLQMLPLYLQAWRADFDEESKVVFSALHDVARWQDLTLASNQETLKSLRENLAGIYEAPTKPKRGQKRPRVCSSSIFEELPSVLQRLALGLLVMLGSPTETTVNGLGCMCAQSGLHENRLSPAMADAVLNAVHSIRRTMSMQVYLQFLISSIGIGNGGVPAKRTETLDEGNTKGGASLQSDAREDGEKKNSQVLDIESVKEREEYVVRASRFLVLCDSAKVLAMISPALKIWIDSVCRDSSLASTQRAVRYRAATAIIAMLVLDIQSFSFGVGGDEISLPSIVDVAPEIAENVVVATLDMFAFPFFQNRTVADSSDVFDYLMKPMLALMKNDVGLVEALLDEISTRFLDMSTVTDALSYLKALMCIVRNSELACSLRKTPKSLNRCCDSAETALANKSSDVESLRVAVDLVVGDSIMSQLTSQ